MASDGILWHLGADLSFFRRRMVITPKKKKKFFAHFGRPPTP
jgi:hypothetical protein